MFVRIIAALAALALSGAFAQEAAGSDAVLDIAHNGARATVRLNLRSTASVEEPAHQGLHVPEPGPGLMAGSTFGITGVAVESQGAGEGAVPVYNYTFGWLNIQTSRGGVTFRAGGFTFWASFAFRSMSGGLVHFTIYPQPRDSFIALGGGGGGYRSDTAIVPADLRPEFAFWATSAYTNGYTDGEGGLMNYGAKPIGIRIETDGFVTIFPLAEVAFSGFGKFDTIQLNWVPRS